MATLGTDAPQWDNRWVLPKENSSEQLELRMVGRIRGHVDLGGVFRDPPMVGIVDGQVLAFDSSRYFTIFADCFGVKCRPFPDEPELDIEDLPKGLKVLKKGAVIWGGERD